MTGSLHDLDPVRARRKAITPRPWTLCEATGHRKTLVIGPMGDGTMGLAACHGFARGDEEVANAAFIAHAPGDIDALMTEVDRLRGLLGVHESEAGLVTVMHQRDEAMRKLDAADLELAALRDLIVARDEYLLETLIRKSSAERGFRGALAALTELVRLKDLKEACFDPVGSWLNGSPQRNDYATNQPKAWAEARRIVSLSPTPNAAGISCPGCGDGLTWKHNGAFCAPCDLVVWPAGGEA